MKATVVGLIILALNVRAQSSPTADEFFETKIRPLLVSRCGGCHGDTVQMGGIQLTTKDRFHKAGVVAPGDIESSRLIQAVRHTGKFKMPPNGKLRDDEIAALEKWVGSGAVWPENAATVTSQSSRKPWAFEPVSKPPIPNVKNTSWPRTEIDRFLFAKLEEKNLAPVQDADKYTLLRRITLDLTGLLPTLEEIQEFEKDSSAGAYERVVDRLLASRAFGDRWGRHWLDITYWADTTGVGRRIPLREAWRYRDYVIKSFNDDKPYNQFIREQIAGKIEDKGEPKPEDLAATGFLVIGPWAWFSYDRVQLRHDVADLQVDLIGRTFLGLTIGCARCHDHKFDPIPNKDYFAMVGIFLSTKTLASRNQNGGINMIRLPDSAEVASTYAGDLAAWEKRISEVEAAEKANKTEREALEKQLEALKKGTQDEASKARMKDLESKIAAVRKRSGTAGDRQILPFTRYMRPSMPEAYVAEDMEFPEDARIAVRGDAHKLGDSVPRGFLKAVSYGPVPEIPPHSSGRKELAEWIANEKNPLTARVYVNRIWHQLFGQGIVATTENFGSRGDAPTNPQLLDYLAARFVETGWSTKKTIREIVLSRAYELSSAQNSQTNNADADNKFQWRANRRRLEAEAIRDAMLQVSGRLDSSRGGPSLPLTAQNVHTIAPFFLEEDSVIEDKVRNRRTVYQPVMRGGQLTDADILNLFDFADPDQVVGVRTQTVVPTQTLYLLNSPFVRESARNLATRWGNEVPLKERVSSIILATLGRPAQERDMEQARQFLDEFQTKLATVPDITDPKSEAWTRYCQAILVSSEFLYRR